MLWSDGQQFVQALEGNDGAVGDTINRIIADRRHTDIETVCDRPINNRIFGSWGMVLADRSCEGTNNTAFIMGYASAQPTPAARRLVDMISVYDG